MIVKAAFAALLALVSVPATPQTSAPVPIDTVARTKFPLDVGADIDRFAFLNRFVNEHIAGISDREHYGIDELWVMFPPDGKGDCEDYVLTKLGLLSMAGFPMVNDTKVVGVIVHLKSGGEGHAILAIRLPSKAVLYMDNRFSEPMTRQELVARGYEFFDWKA